MHSPLNVIITTVSRADIKPCVRYRRVLCLSQLSRVPSAAQKIKCLIQYVMSCTYQTSILCGISTSLECSKHGLWHDIAILVVEALGQQELRFLFGFGCLEPGYALKRLAAFMLDWEQRAWSGHGSFHLLPNVPRH